MAGGKGGRGSGNQRADVHNPNNPAYKAAADNRSNQMNPNNDAYWTSRGYDERPDDWQERSTNEGELQDRPKNNPTTKK